ncbi:hypothetical protein MHLP_02180 [Candidatus Mycoplasma haematolamae str. Purdue]|uniref:Uncharacterized protein n=1 Tax=Mycoplasma haematolamae (strain Purdue) TaxID=1212765 RepID=I7CFM8_MYCHA|nr:hypothetical protein [Candidatus Mycoplasma haematolamae]AFO52016.1 hypothetical protein MHLP_02180 [Candidatus Mycoplasma haematolamae str. Purdue]
MLPFKIFALSVTGVTAIGGTGAGISKLVTGKYIPWQRSEAKEDDVFTLQVPSFDVIPVKGLVANNDLLDMFITTHVFNAFNKTEVVSSDPVKEPRETVKSEIKGNLALFKGQLEDDYYLDTEYEGKNEGLVNIPFSVLGVKEEIEDFVDRFNENLWLDAQSLEGFLEGLKAHKSVFEKVFTEEIYKNLEEKVQELQVKK